MKKEKIIVLHFSLRIILNICLFISIVVFSMLLFEKVIIWDNLSKIQQFLFLILIGILCLSIHYSFRKRTYIYIDSFQNKYLIDNNDLVNSNDFGSNLFINFTILLKTLNRQKLLQAIKEQKLNCEKYKIKKVTKTFGFLHVNKYRINSNSKKKNLIVFNDL